jgi:hypothetical protein
VDLTGKHERSSIFYDFPCVCCDIICVASVSVKQFSQNNSGR